MFKKKLQKCRYQKKVHVECSSHSSIRYFFHFRQVLYLGRSPSARLKFALSADVFFFSSSSPFFWRRELSMSSGAGESCRESCTSEIS